MGSFFIYGMFYGNIFTYDTFLFFVIILLEVKCNKKIRGKTRESQI